MPCSFGEAYVSLPFYFTSQSHLHENIDYKFYSFGWIPLTANDMIRKEKEDKGDFEFDCRKKPIDRFSSFVNSSFAARFRMRRGQQQRK
jgi:hypothetical protein